MRQGSTLGEHFHGWNFDLVMLTIAEFELEGCLLITCAIWYQHGVILSCIAIRLQPSAKGYARASRRISAAAWGKAVKASWESFDRIRISWHSSILFDDRVFDS